LKLSLEATLGVSVVVMARDDRPWRRTGFAIDSIGAGVGIIGQGGGCRFGVVPDGECVPE